MRSRTPDFPGRFPVRSSSTRFEFDFRDEARVLYPSSVILQSESLNIHKKLLSTTPNALIAPASFEFHSILQVLFKHK